MTPEQALKIVERIADYFPAWMSGKSERDIGRTLVAWASELVPLGQAQTVAPLVHECLQSMPGKFPPGIFEIRSYVQKRLRAIEGTHKALPPPDVDPEVAKKFMAEIFEKLDEKKQKKLAKKIENNS